jgi:hypothetical protein
MIRNEPIVAASKNLIESYVCSEKKYFKPADTSEEAKYYAELLEGMFQDLENPFEDYLKDFLTMADYGFQLSEIVLKKRLGSNPEDPRKNSRYNDGLIAPRKFAPRPQKTITKWKYDNYGRIKSVTQDNPTYFTSHEIPYSKLLHFKIKSYNGNPEGTSIYRACALAFYSKQKIKRLQQIRYARGFDGIPKITLPIEWCSENDSEHSAVRKWAQDSVSNIAIGQDCGIVIPEIISPKSLKPLITFEIVSGNTPVGMNAEEMLSRLDREIATSVLSDFFLGGSGASITGTLGQMKVETFAQFVLTFLNSITNEINNKLIPLIFELNGFNKEFMPKLVHTNLCKLEKTNIFLYLQSLGKTGLWTKTKDRENALIDFIFGGLIPDVSQEEFDEQIQRDDVVTQDSLDAPNSDNFEDEYMSKTDKE